MVMLTSIGKNRLRGIGDTRICVGGAILCKVILEGFSKQVMSKSRPDI
jgi:hypothetical protein